jgi:hypothetical protein
MGSGAAGAANGTEAAAGNSTARGSRRVSNCFELFRIGSNCFEFQLTGKLAQQQHDAWQQRDAHRETPPAPKQQKNSMTNF